MGGGRQRFWSRSFYVPKALTPNRLLVAAGCLAAGCLLSQAAALETKGLDRLPLLERAVETFEEVVKLRALHEVCLQELRRAHARDDHPSTLGSSR